MAKMLHASDAGRRYPSLACRWLLGIGFSALFLNMGTIVSAKTLEPPVQLAQGRTSNPQQIEADRLFDQGIQQYKARQQEAALQSWQQALTLYRVTGDRMGEGSTLSNLGLVYRRLGDYDRAIQFMQQSLDIAQELKDRLGEGKILTNLGLFYGDLGDYGKSIAYQQSSLKIKREIGDQAGEVLSLINLGKAYDTVGDYSRAIGFLDQGLALARARQDRRSEGIALLNLGNASYALQNYSQALKFQKQSLAVAQEIQDRQAVGLALGNLGNTYDALGDKTKAIEAYQQSLAIARELKDRRSEGSFLSNLGNIYAAMGDSEQAIQYQQQSLAIARELKDRRSEGQSLNNLGLDLFKAQKLEQAEQTFQASIQAYESLRQGLQDIQKVSLADAQSSPYNNLQKVLIAQNKVESALEISERGRARAFAELLVQRTQGTTAPTLLPIDIAAIKQIAREQKATLVEYANLYDEQLLIWVIKPTGEVIFRQVDLKPLNQQKTTLTNLVAAARCLGMSACEQAVAAKGARNLAFNPAPSEHLLASATLRAQNDYLKRLHQLLIEPIADVLPQTPKDLLPGSQAERIIFIPQGILFLVPWAALQDQQGNHLIDRHTISIAPSIQVLQLTRQQRRQPGKFKGDNLLLVGNPTMPKVSFNPGDPPQQLSALPGAEAEAQAISKLLSVPALIGGQATKAKIWERMLSAQTIHLATHGLLDDFGGKGVPGAIALAPSGSDNGLLTANELLDVKLKAELVVLSACDTGQGKITGDGVIGLSRSLITAGVPSVIVSLWAIPDAPTAELMLRFYQNLGQGHDKAQALRQAMLATKQVYPDPSAWAAFVLIGEAE